MTLARRERDELLDVSRQLGPDAPTLCEGWTTHDLLAHLWVREHVPQALPGLVVPALHPVTERAEQRARRRFGFDELLEALAQPPAAARLAGDAGNLHEFFVHHEDVRRANQMAPRPADPELDQGLWRRLRAMGPVLFRRARPVDLVLSTPEGRHLRVVPFARGERVEVVGPVPELFLLAFDRHGAAQVEWVGDAQVVAALRGTTFGL